MQVQYCIIILCTYKYNIRTDKTASVNTNVTANTTANGNNCQHHPPTPTAPPLAFRGWRYSAARTREGKVGNGLALLGALSLFQLMCVQQTDTLAEPAERCHDNEREKDKAGGGEREREKKREKEKEEERERKV
jgi:hypothetical protein